MTGTMWIIMYGVVFFGLSWIVTKNYLKSKEEFLVAQRNIPGKTMSFSIAASWIWAPALFVGSMKAYTQGWTGLAWFTVPNFLSLCLCGYLVYKVRQITEENQFTMAGWMGKFSKRIRILFTLEMILVAVYSLSLQGVAAGGAVSKLTSVSFEMCIILLLLVAISYTILAGIRSSVITDVAQMVLILGAVFLIVPYVINMAGGFESVVSGLNGKEGVDHPFSGKGWLVAITFGLPYSLSLFSGTVGDQMFWQRGFAVKKGETIRAFTIGACLFVVVPLMLGLLGFVAAGNPEIEVTGAFLVGLDVVKHYTPDWVLIVFTIALISGLISTVDSSMTATSSLVGHDLAEMTGIDKSKHVMMGRVGIVCVAILGYIVAVSGLKPLQIMLIFGSIRVATLMPIFFTVLKKGCTNEKTVFWATFTPMISTVPLFIYYTLQGDKVTAGYMMMGTAVIGTLIFTYEHFVNRVDTAPIELGLDKKVKKAKKK